MGSWIVWIRYADWAARAVDGQLNRIEAKVWAWWGKSVKLSEHNTPQEAQAQGRPMRVITYQVTPPDPIF